MKVKVPSLMKKIIAAFSNKTNDLRVRLMIFFLLHKNFDKTSLTNSLQALVSHHPHHKKKNDDAIDEKEELELVENRLDNKEHEDDEEEMNGHSLLLNYNKATSMMGVRLSGMVCAAWALEITYG
uniref:Uncharacterized protein n=1 Tax=Chenopodium quinoa TaxID=63459 RepID=A0A803MMN2_CHEQI